MKSYLDFLEEKVTEAKNAGLPLNGSGQHAIEMAREYFLQRETPDEDVNMEEFCTLVVFISAKFGDRGVMRMITNFNVLVDLYKLHILEEEVAKVEGNFDA